MATKYENLCHISISENTPKYINDPKVLRHISPNVDNLVELKNEFAVKVMDAIDDEIVKKVIEEAKAAGINDVYLMDRDFIRNAIKDAIAKTNKSNHYKNGDFEFIAKIYLMNELVRTKEFTIEELKGKNEELKTELAKARGGCQRLRESKEELQECVQTLKKNFDEERDARIKRDKQYADLFEKCEQLKRNCQGLLPQYRPCYVGDRIALFHGWFNEHARSYRNPEPINTIYALVEFENGFIKKVSPCEIRFMDHECHRVWEARK